MEKDLVQYKSEGFIALEPLLFFVGEHGCIQNFSESVLRLSRMGEADIIGMHLREFLLKLNFEWEDVLPKSIPGYFDSQVFLSWSAEDTFSLGWTVHAISAGVGDNSSISFSFVPSLAPDITNKVPESGLDESLGNAVHKLFLHAQQSDNRFRSLMKLIPGVSFIQKDDLSFSSKVAELKILLGPSVFSELDHQTWTDWIHPGDAPLFYESLMHCESTHHPVSSKIRLILPNKKTLYLLDLRFPVLGLDGRIRSYEVLWIDLTRERTAEKRLHESAWKNSLAEVSGSLTHDFNNLMTGVVNLTDITLSSCQGCSRTKSLDHMGLVYKCAKQAQGLVQQVVSLNRNQPGRVELFDLRSFVKEQYELIRIVLPPSIRFEINLGDEELPVRLDKAILSRAILNFATNSRDAIPKNGQVILTLNLVNLRTYHRDHIFTSLCRTSGRAVELVFEDDGEGIDPHHINQVFSPYFSTKMDKNGTGLGLSSLYRYAEDNGFDFGVRSTLGEGTAMLLLLPLDELVEEEPETLPTTEGGSKSFKPGFQEELNVSIYGKDPKYASFIESNLEQDFGVQTNLMRSSDQVLAWFDSTASRGAVFVAMFRNFEEVPVGILGALQLSFGLTCRILMLNHSIEEDSHSLDEMKKYFDIVLQTTEIPNYDNVNILRSLGHSALFALHDFS